MYMNSSYFKPEFSGKPEEDPETCIHRTTGWMDTHSFAMGQRIHRFPLALAGEGRLLYQCIHPFRTQFSKIGYTREQLFHVWRSIHFSEDAETIDDYIHRIRQAVTVLYTDKPQVLNV